MEELNMKIIEGNLVAKDLKIGIVAARFNEFIVSNTAVLIIKIMLLLQLVCMTTIGITTLFQQN